MIARVPSLAHGTFIARPFPRARNIKPSRIDAQSPRVPAQRQCALSASASSHTRALAPSERASPAARAGERTVVVADTVRARANALNDAMSAHVRVALLALALALWLRKCKLYASSSTPRRKVIVLGAGFAGVQAAIDLRAHCDVEVIDGKEYFEFVPGTLAALAGARPMSMSTFADDAATRAQRAIMVPYAQIFKDKRVKFTCTRGREIDVRDDCVIIRGERSSMEDVRLAYDELIVATGSVYAGVIKSSGVGREMTMQGRMDAYAEARASIVRGNTTTIIVGGGVVGVELAAELAARATKANNGSSVVLLHAGERLLDMLPDHIGSYVTKALIKSGVKVYVGQKYERDGENAFIGVANKNVIRGDYVLMAIGSKPATEFLKRATDDVGENATLDVPLDQLGRIRIDPSTRRVIGVESRVYAVGDVASKPPEHMLASYAHWEAEYVATRIKYHGNAKALAKLGAYVPPPRLMAISLGSFDGVMVWGDRVVATGIVAAMFKALVQFWFIRFLPAPYGVMKMLPHMRCAPRDPARLSPASSS